MANPEVRVFPDLEELSRAAAARFAGLARQREGEGKTFCAALSGGSTPRRLYELLANSELQIPWPSVHLFQVDERCVPPDHAESNFRMIREALLARVPIPDGNFHRMAAERENLEEAARQYAFELARVLQPKESEPPRFDLLLLGLGPDGHTASLFPGTAALQEQSAWVRANYVEKLKMYRLTLTLPVVNAARQVVFLVAGEGKADVLRQVLEGPTGRFPAQRIRPVEGGLSWYVDKAAAKLLAAGARSG
jgi:6-phosphogluconolactonase